LSFGAHRFNVPRLVVEIHFFFPPQKYFLSSIRSVAFFPTPDFPRKSSFLYGTAFFFYDLVFHLIGSCHRRFRVGTPPTTNRLCAQFVGNLGVLLRIPNLPGGSVSPQICKFQGVLALSGPRPMPFALDLPKHWCIRSHPVFADNSGSEVFTAPVQ